MAKLSQVDVFRCDCCGKETIANTHDIKTTAKYCGSTEPITLTQENVENTEVTPNTVNTIQLPYIHRNIVNVVNRGGLDFEVGGPKGSIANEVKMGEYHVCKDCMNNMMDDFADFMNTSAEFQEKYFDTSFD